MRAVRLLLLAAAAAAAIAHEDGAHEPHEHRPAGGEIGAAAARDEEAAVAAGSSEAVVPVAQGDATTVAMSIGVGHDGEPVVVARESEAEHDGHGHGHGDGEHVVQAISLSQTTDSAAAHGDHSHSHDGHAHNAAAVVLGHSHDGHHHDHHSHDHDGHAHNAATVVPGHSHDDHHHDHHSHDHDHGHHGHDDHHDDHDHDGHAHGADGDSAHRAHRRLRDEEKHPYTAVLLTTASGLAAVLGGIIVVMIGAPSATWMGHMLSFAAGIMMYISYGDLLPHAMGDMGGDAAVFAPMLGFTATTSSGQHDHDHDHDHGHGHSHSDLPAFVDANIWMLVGMLGFLLVITVVPEPEVGGHDHDDQHHHDDGAAAADADAPKALLPPPPAPEAETAAAAAAADVAPSVAEGSASTSTVDGLAASLREEASRLNVVQLKERLTADGAAVTATGKSGLIDEYVARRLAAAAATGASTDAVPPSNGGARHRRGSDAANTSRPAPTSAAAVAPAAAAAAPSLSSPSSSANSAAAAATRSRLLMTGLVAAIGISLHNLPEGLIVYNQTITGICTPAPTAGGDAVAAPAPAAHGDRDGLLWSAWGAASHGLEAMGLPPLPTDLSFDVDRCLSRGVAVTFAIFLHNIPEGMAVASPIYVSTGSKWQALKYTLLSSLCEPAAAILFGLAFSSLLTPYVVAALNAAVAGIMICLCLVELLPVAASHVGARWAALSNIAGQLVMFASLAAMRRSGVH